MKLTSVTAWRYWDWGPKNDRDFTGLPVYTRVNNPTKQNQYTQELRYAYDAGKIDFTPIDDGGGPLTVQALVDGDVDMVDLYSTTPAISELKFVVLEDPESMIIAQQVFPLVSDRVPESADDTLNAVSKALTTEDLIAMNARNQGDEKASPATIAEDWLKEKGLI